MIDLMDKRSVSMELGSLAGKLRTSRDVAAAGRLHQLALAVNGGSYADAWATTNLHQMIGLDAILEQYRMQKFSNRLIDFFEVVRNTLIFAPLVITWFYISRAVASYSQYIGEFPDQARTPFLFLWQQGFGGLLAEPLTLSWMAFIDFSILLGVLGLTFVVHILSTVKREKDVNELQGRLMNALAGASLCLTARKSLTPINVGDGLRDLVNKLDTSTASLMKRMEDLHLLQDTQIKTSIGFRADLIAKLTNLGTAINGLTGANASLATNISTTMNATAGKLDALLLKTDGALTALQQEIIEQGKILKEQQSWGLILKDSLDKLGKATQASDSTVIEYGKVIKQLDQLLKELANHQMTSLANTTKQQASQQQLENDVRATVVHAQSIAKEVRQCALDLRGYTHDMNELVRRVAALV